MSEALAPILFQSETRSALLELLFVQGLSASVSELARRSGLSVRAVANEVNHLAPTGLLLIEAVGGADVVRANAKHPAARHLRALFGSPAAVAPDELVARKVRESLVAWGAPLSGLKGARHFGLEDSVLRGLNEARRDGTVLRVLPTVLARNAGSIDWVALREEARRRKMKAELGWLIELTAELVQRPELKAEAASLHDKRRRTLRFYPAVKSGFEEELARLRSPASALNWGFWMNISDESFRSTLEKHRA